MTPREAVTRALNALAAVYLLPVDDAAVRAALARVRELADEALAVTP